MTIFSLRFLAFLFFSLASLTFLSFIFVDRDSAWTLQEVVRILKPKIGLMLSTVELEIWCVITRRLLVVVKSIIGLWCFKHKVFWWVLIHHGFSISDWIVLLCSDIHYGHHLLINHSQLVLIPKHICGWWLSMMNREFSWWRFSHIVNLSSNVGTTHWRCPCCKDCCTLGILDWKVRIKVVAIFVSLRRLHIILAFIVFRSSSN